MCETYLSSFLFIKTIAWEIKGGRQAEIPEIIVNLLDIMDSRWENLHVYSSRFYLGQTRLPGIIWCFIIKNDWLDSLDLSFHIAINHIFIFECES